MRKTLIIAAIVLAAAVAIPSSNVLADKAINGPRIPVLLYHHLLPAEDNANFQGNGMVLDTADFERQMKYLSDRSYHCLTLGELRDFLAGKSEPPRKSVMITFDDGYLSNWVYAYPLMKKYGLTGVIFLLTGEIGEKEEPFDPDKLQYLNLEAMARMGDVFEFGSHTDSLHRLDESGVSALVSSDSGTVIADLARSREVAESGAFAYPYGQFNEDTQKYLRQGGFDLAFTTCRGFVRRNSDGLALDRITVYPGNGMLAFMKIFLF